MKLIIVHVEIKIVNKEAATKRSTLFHAQRQGEHQLWQCGEFADQSVSVRKRFSVQNLLCFNCLKPGHRAVSCKLKKTCESCGKKQNTLLHESTFFPVNNEDHSSDQKSVVALTKNDKENVERSKVLLSILPVQVWSENNSVRVSTYALLDTGSTANLCTTSLVNKLNISINKESTELQGVNSINRCSGRIGSLSVKGLEEHEVCQLRSVGVVNNLPDMRENVALENVIQQYKHLSDLRLSKIDSSKVELLIGMNAHEVFQIKEQRCGEIGEPFTWHTTLGWTIFGTEFHETLNVDAGENDKVLLSLTKCSSEDLRQKVFDLFGQDFKDLDEEQHPEISLEDLKALSIMEKTTRKVSNHYVMKLPWKDDKAVLSNNRVMAEKRLKCLRAKLRVNDELRSKYVNKINEYIKSGHASLAPKEITPNKTWYLPHHSTGNKFRVVFDCAAKFKGFSINDKLLQGPDLNNNLTGVLLRFRQESVAFAADIRSMFHQVLVDECDRDTLRFLWWQDDDWNKPPVDYRMNVLLFGSTCSPSCAAFALQQTARDNITGASEDVQQTVMNNFYVDDLLKSCANVEEAKNLISQLNPLLESGGFHLTKFVASKQDILTSVPDRDCALKEQDVCIQGDHVQKALGVYWNTSADRLTVKVNVEKRSFTRRGLLSMISQVHDVLGLVQPFILPGRKLLQEACRDQTEWDDPLPEKIFRQFETWVCGLKELSNVSVPRSFKLPGLVCARKELHVFCDASTIGYGAVCYIRTIGTDQTTNCTFCMGKSRVSPLKPVSVPRLELTAATIAVKLSTFVCNQLEFEFDYVNYWTDAMIVLRYIHNTASRFHTFVANRLRLIQSLTNTKQWRYVPTKRNPADVVSRGLMPNKVETADL